MIRERRNKEKLALYYKKFMEEALSTPTYIRGWQNRAALPQNETAS